MGALVKCARRVPGRCAVRVRADAVHAARDKRTERNDTDADAAADLHCDHEHAQGDFSGATHAGRSDGMT
jgi:predicted deacylase